MMIPQKRSSRDPDFAVRRIPGWTGAREHDAIGNPQDRFRTENHPAAQRERGLLDVEIKLPARVQFKGAPGDR